jgi:hypothetical protein
MPRLNRLILNRTQVSDEGLTHLKEVPNLADLNLHGRPITRKGLEHLLGVRNLQALTLHGVPIADDDIEPLRDLSSLQSVSLQCTNVSKKGIDRLRAALPRCRIVWHPDPNRGAAEWAQAHGAEIVLHLGGDPKRSVVLPPDRPLPQEPFRLISIAKPTQVVTDKNFVALELIRHLESLDLPRTELGDAEIEEICDTLYTSKLRTFHLGAPITDVVLPHFRRWTSLTDLTLNCPKVTDAGLEHLKALKTLRRLDLRGTKATAAGVKALAEALPACQIESEHGIIEPAMK